MLLIFRRGVWDLPKGKRDAGETIEACALREVREEIGVGELRLARELGTTVHDCARLRAQGPLPRKDDLLVSDAYFVLRATVGVRFGVKPWSPGDQSLSGGRTLKRPL